jgi:uncharacterized protein YecT (DUF1311 family)
MKIGRIDLSTRSAVFVVVLFSDFAAVNAVAAPSFDCRRAATMVEKEICGGPELSTMDREVDALYQRALLTLDKTNGERLKKDQRAWVAERNACEDFIHGDPVIMADVLACSRESMTARSSRLRAIIEHGEFFK